MAERKRNRKKKEHSESSVDDGKPTKDEYAIAKYLRQKLPEKRTMLLGHKVDYFIASRAIDCLLDSPWATKSAKQELLFTTRDSIVEFLDKMLQHKFFHRAKKIIVQKEPKKKKKEEETVTDSSKEVKDKKEKDKKGTAKSKELKDKKDSSKEKESKDITELAKSKESSKESDKKDSKTKEKDEEEKAEDKKEGEKEEKKKEKKKVKLDMHLEQLFVDGNEAYVWIYDPIPMRTWIIGMSIVVGAVVVCLFPLWPQSIRHYIYYLSVAAAFFLVFIIGLAIIRVIVFVIIWIFTFGKHHLWLLPNLTEDVGFFESFWPLYKYEYKGGSKEKKDSKKDDDEEGDKESEEKTSKETKENAEKSDSNSEQEKEDFDEDDQMHSESEQESEKDKTENGDKTENSDKTDNGFEIIDPEETQPHNKSD